MSLLFGTEPTPLRRRRMSAFKVKRSFAGSVLSLRLTRSRRKRAPPRATAGYEALMEKGELRLNDEDQNQ
jgi:hypothetical protein